MVSRVKPILLRINTIPPTTTDVRKQEPSGKDAGKYKCVAMNQFGEATANVNLNIESEPEAQGEPPTFVEKPSIKWEEGAGRVLMIALVKADPKPSAAWSREGAAVVSGGKYTVTLSDERPDVYRIQLELRVLALYAL